MGQQISSAYFEEEIAEARALSSVLRVVYRRCAIRLLVGALLRAPEAALMDYLAREVKYLVSYVPSSGYTVAQALYPDGVVHKALTHDDFASLRAMLYGLHAVLAAGSCGARSTSAGGALTSGSSTRGVTEECPVCLDNIVNVVLPCSHSLCSSCADDVKRNHSTCPVCRQELLLGEAGGYSGEWVLEDWNQSDVQKDFENHCTIISQFLESLPVVSPAVLSTHRVVALDDGASGFDAARNAPGPERGGSRAPLSVHDLVLEAALAIGAAVSGEAAAVEEEGGEGPGISVDAGAVLTSDTGDLPSYHTEENRISRFARP
jgi:RNA polymerase subunit RPABC4/transcription elongation factor Spt4